MNQLQRRIFYTLSAIASVAILCIAYSYFIEPSRLVVNSATIQVPNWNKAYDGIRIVMIGDVHGGSNNVTEAKIRRIVELTNAQNPDLIVLLGDYVSQNRENRSIRERSLKMPMETVAENLRGLKAPLGVYAVLGNHDEWYSNTNVTHELERIGVRVLQDEIATVEKNGQKLRILGLKDQLNIRSWDDYSEKLKRVIAEDNGTGDIIVLEHSPDVLPIVTGDLSISPELKLFLAAHTHGGQVWFPVLGTLVVPSSYGQKYSYGHVRENGVDMFVTSGIGTSVLPIRFMMPPEIVSLTVVSE